ncbi:RNA polymerase-associated protein RapA [Pasteurellaceae bacterium USgator11]|nr:RNA polymerase-associated protein RapA [Pasteurellaceae bacterium UScroc12]TNG96020.1 RNA polymerase-associated protein RapA [Pasteurellaceae bacterium USgator41]TNG98588.1 RNA polymerase-associated protein RapA [Pasteurellaceae bacterium UScroc31]TNG99997.1 RNA polymerase-associated protein RapA [Pasteurellaceae bacterium USgator11]
MTAFVIGQRWISESENGLGLGIVVGVDQRTVTLLFPAAEEQRVYAFASAPLTRVQFNPGDSVKHHQGWQLQVAEVHQQQGVLSYQGVRLDNGESAVLREMELDHKISFSKPQDRLFAAQIDRNEHFNLRFQALTHQQAQFQSPLRGLRGIRAGLIPHQLHIATEVGHRIAPRVLLADEVGLGKTIEAGMILQQQRFSGKAERVLIIVPESLQHQWLVEMLRRFNLPFSLFDEERSQDFDGQNGESTLQNPFDTEALVICSLDWLVQQPSRAAQLSASQWDMLIVDEAHHLQWSESQPSAEYQLIETLAQQTPSVLLLTATPEQLGQQSHFARLKLLDPERFYDYAAFVEEQQQYQPVADAVNTLLNDKTLSAIEQNSIADLLSEQDIEPLFKIINGKQSSVEQKTAARQELISNLIDRHGTSRVLFRNTRQAVKGFPNRTLHQIKLALPKQYQNALKVWQMLGEDVADDVLFYPEMLFQKLNPSAAWWDFDPRIEWLLTFLKNHRDEKILLICQHANTAIQLEQILREKEGIRAAVFHEKMSIIERDKSAAYFAQHEDGAQILLSSTIGSEGRNFQFASNLVLFNLPTNPDLLEQCIGRLDRIGQQHDIQIYVPFFADSSQQLLAQWYHDGLNTFEETCPMGAAIFAQHKVRLQAFLTETAEGDDFAQFVKATRQQREQLKLELEQGRDRLLELNSNGGESAQQLAADIASNDAATDLIQFSLNLFDIIGLEQEDLGEKSIAIHPTGHMLVPDFPGLKEDGSTVTFDRQLALAREELEFLTWDHPMIRNGIDLIAAGDIGKSAVAVLVNKALPAGTLLLELIYVVEVQAPPALQLNRFLPPTPIRLLLDNKGNDLAEQVAFTALQRQLKPMGKNIANKIVKMTRSAVEQGLQQGEKLIVAKAQRLIDEAKMSAEQQLNSEYQRLTALQAVNKNIRQDEVIALEQLQQQSLQQLQQATWRLDSLRLIVSNKE